MQTITWLVRCCDGAVSPCIDEARARWHAAAFRGRVIRRITDLDTGKQTDTEV